MKNSLTLPSLGCMYFITLTDESDEPLHTYKYKNMRSFVSQKIEGGRFAIFKKKYESIIADKVLSPL